MSRIATELIFVAITVGGHLIGAVVLVSVLLKDEGGSWRSWWPRDDDGPSDPSPAPAEPARGGGLPLPDAVPAALRVRDGGRLADAHELPPRRPAEVPAREPVPSRTPV